MVNNPLASHNKKITFGKHKGKTPLWVYLNDNQYFTWCLNNLKSPKWVSIFATVLDLKEPEPEIKEDPCTHPDIKTHFIDAELFCRDCGEVLF